jgi:uncharacterized protein with FMN-binding domain
MRRAPVVITGTALGLAGVLSFRSVPATVSLAGLSSPTTAPSTTVAGAGPPTTARSATTTTPTTPATTTPSAATTVPTTRATPTTVATTAPPTTVASTRSATGPVVNYYFGTVSVKVTVSGSKITAVSIASLNDGGNPRSQYIDQQALPMLVQQALAAQSANIQGVSGATYTSEGFYTSLAAALKDLGLA